MEGYLNVDICPPADAIADLTIVPWPWPDSSVDEIVARDVFEHLPDKRRTMHEVYRVLKPGGRAVIEVPCAAHGSGADQDPTHVSRWTGNDFEYYEKGNYARERFRGSSYYGIKADFLVLGVEHSQYMGKWDEVFKIEVVLEALK